jgi:hypothetical protein
MEVADQLHSQAALPKGKEPKYSLDKVPGEAQNRCERCAE